MFGVTNWIGALTTTDRRQVHVTWGTGPIGTGIFLAEAGRIDDGVVFAEEWVRLFFFPIVPRQVVTLSSGLETGTVGLHVLEETRRLTSREVLRGYLYGLLGALGVGALWGVIYLSASYTSLLGGLIVAFAGGVTVAWSAWLDMTTPRVSRRF